MGCDNVLESGAQKDSCGVCNGDNSGATTVSGTLTVSGEYGYHKIVVIPARAINVRITEVTVNSSVYLGKQVAKQVVLCRYIVAM